MTSQTETRRRDIDGLRAIAVLSVIFFHQKVVEFGYLGVDVFFVISGFLIIGAIDRQARAGVFSIVEFYVRRTRRIIPLVLFSSLVALIAGCTVMLPDDLENLAQSIIATIFSANNILLHITSRDYWAIVNDYKPLMHTWSLGVEEQFYLLIPLLYVSLPKKWIKLVFPTLVIFTVLSIAFFVFSQDPSARFYLLHYRFFELGVGGIAAVALNGRLVKIRYPFLLYAILAALVFADFPMPEELRLLATIVVSLALLVADKTGDKISTLLFENRMIVWVGKISFSLYIWHQIMLAFGRYFLVETFNFMASSLFLMLLFVTSAASYFFIEKPFQNASKFSTKCLMVLLATLGVGLAAASFYLYGKSGVIRDIPELGIYRWKHSQRLFDGKRNTHIQYNARIYDLDKPFGSQEEKIRVFVIGNSFARDFVNVLLESEFRDRIDVSYSSDLLQSMDVKNRFHKADLVIFSEVSRAEADSISMSYGFDRGKVWNVGPKNFGFNNGIFFNKSRDSLYYRQRTNMIPGVIERNNELAKQWGNHYIDMVELFVDANKKVPVFTSEHKFFSQDCAHLTRSGAMEISRLVDFKFLPKPVTMKR